MFRAKSFDLVSAEDSAKKEKLYQPKTIRQMKYIVAPVLLAFILLLILANVNFSGDQHYSHSNFLSTNKLQFTAIPTERAQFRILSDTSTTSTKSFKCIDDNKCIVSCSGGKVEDVTKVLEKQQAYCPGELELVLESCSLPLGKLESDLFSGNYRLKSLTIDSCDFEVIGPGAFQQKSLKTLKSLIIKKSHFRTLTAKSFEGLESLDSFSLIQEQIWYVFEGENFLVPMSAALTSLLLRVQQNAERTIYDPARWLAGSPLAQLTHVDLSDNYFSNKLTYETFESLIVVRELILKNCKITSIGVRTFNQLMKTLSLLDLSNNELTTLNWDFLANVPSDGLSLDLSTNKWNCTCENKVLFEYVLDPNIVFVGNPKCATPDDLMGIDIRTVEIVCSLPTTTVKHLPTPPVKPLPTTSESRPPTTETMDIDETTDSTVKSTTGVMPEQTTKTPRPIPPTPPIPHTSPTPPEPHTSTTPPTLPPIDPPRFTNIQCVRTPWNQWQEIWDYDAVFTIRVISSSSVRLEIKSDMKHLDIVYFQDANTTVLNRQTIQNTDEADPCQRTMIIGNSLTVQEISGLMPDQGYTFCLVRKSETETSPFNCHSQFLHSDPKLAWLHHDDVVLCVTLVVLGIVLCIVFGLVGAYWLLRWRPTWFGDTQRLRRLKSKSNKVVLLPKEQSADNGYSGSSNSGTADLRQNIYVESNNYMDFIRSHKQTNSRKTINVADISAPTEQAPSIPNAESTIRSKKIIAPSDEDLYESIDFYQELF